MLYSFCHTVSFTERVFSLAFCFLILLQSIVCKFVRTCAGTSSACRICSSRCVGKIGIYSSTFPPILVDCDSRQWLVRTWSSGSRIKGFQIHFTCSKTAQAYFWSHAKVRDSLSRRIHLGITTCYDVHTVGFRWTRIPLSTRMWYQWNRWRGIWNINSLEPQMESFGLDERCYRREQHVLIRRGGDDSNL